MAKDVLVTTELSDAAIDAGDRLVRLLDKDGGRVLAAFWLQQTLEDSWRLVLVSPLVSDEGPRALYDRISHLLDEIGADESAISLSDIEALPPSSRLMHNMMQGHETRHAITGKRISGSAAGGEYIEGVYLYRMHPIDLEHEYYASLVIEHREWLERFDSGHLDRWNNILNSNTDAALVESAVRRLLVKEGLTVSPGENLEAGTGGPDFHCKSAEADFDVEVTSISIGKAAKATRLRHFLGGDDVSAQHFQPLTDLIFEKCKDKTPQCGNRPRPTLVAVGTFHFGVSTACFNRGSVQMMLTGRQYASVLLNKSGAPIGSWENATSLESASFLKPDNDKAPIGARECISGLLLCGFGTSQPNVLGALHPYAARPFQPQWLPNIPFCEVQISKSSVSTIWHQLDEE